MIKILTPEFFHRKTLAVARDLVGKYLVRSHGGKTVKLRVVEVEAYVGPHDLASHSSKGRTARTEIMFGAPGRFYTYLIYGMYWMLNVVTEKEGHASAILIRGVEGISGPGRLTKKLAIDNKLNGMIAEKKTGLWFEDHDEPTPRIKRTPRIGIKYAGEIWEAKPYRFVLDDK